MKYLLFAVLALAGAVPAAAQSNITNVHEVSIGTTTLTQTINLCSIAGAADVAAATSSGTVSGAWAIEVYNPAVSTNTVNCGFDLGLSTSIASSVWYGREVIPGVGLTWAVSPQIRKVYCMTQNTLGCTKLTITQFK